MKRRLVILSLFTLLVSIWLYLDCRPAIARPKMVLDETTYSFGEVKEGTSLEHKFIVHNKGDSPLKIHNVRPG